MLAARDEWQRHHETVSAQLGDVKVKAKKAVEVKGGAAGLAKLGTGTPALSGP